MGRNTEFLFIPRELTLFLIVAVGAIEGRGKETSVHGTLIENHTIFLIIPRITGDCYDGIQSRWQVIRRQGMN